MIRPVFMSRDIPGSRRKPNRHARRRLSIESLEERRMLSNLPIWVDSGDDSGAGTLRQAIDTANTRAGQDLIIIESSVPAIGLHSNLPPITEGVTIKYDDPVSRVLLTRYVEPNGIVTGGLGVTVDAGVSNAYVRFEGLDIGGFTWLDVGTGISGYNKSGTVEIYNCSIRQNSDDGIHLWDCEGVEIRNSLIQYNGNDGIRLENIAWPNPYNANDPDTPLYGEVDANTVRYNGGDGIVFSDCDNAYASRNTVTHNTGNGIVLQAAWCDKAINDAKLYGNFATLNDEAGIYVNAETGGTIDGVEIRPLDAPATGAYYRSLIEGNSGAGIYLRADGLCEYESNTYYSAMSNVFIGGAIYDGQASSLVAANEIHENDGHGIRIQSSAEAGISDVDIRANLIEENGNDGVNILSTTDGVVSNINISPFVLGGDSYLNRMKSNGGDGIEIEAGIDSQFLDVTIRRNTIISNSGYGVRINGADSTQIEENYIGIRPDDSLYGNVMGGILLAGNTNDGGAEANTVTGNWIGDSGSDTEDSPGILIDDADCHRNLFTENRFRANRGEAVVLASGSQGGLGDITPVIGGIAQTRTGWNVPVTLDAGSTFIGCEFTAEFYAYNATTKHYYVLTEPDDEEPGQEKPIEATATAGPDGSVTIRGEITLDDLDDLPTGYDLCALVYCSDEGEPSLVDNTTVFSAARALPTVRVTGEYVFYNNSVWDGTSDNDAVDTTRKSLYPGEQATGENVTCYDEGLNGAMIDVVGFTGNTGDVTASDFDFYVRNTSSGDFEAIADPTVSMYSYTVDTDGDGIGDTAAHRIKFIFPDGTASGTWLKIDVLASGDVGLDADHTFYFGNLHGDVGGGTGSQPDLQVGSADLDLVRAFWGQTVSGVNSWQSGDANSDTVIGSADLDVVRANWGASLAGFTAPARGMAAQSSSASSTPTWTAEADKVYERYGLLDDDPTNDVAVDEKFWDDLYDALGLTFA